VALPRNVTNATLLIIVFILILIGPHQVSGSITCSSSQSSFWKICGPIEALGGIDEQPTAVQASDGTLRLAWAHLTGAGVSNIYYSTRLANGTWTGASAITNLGGRNQFPSIIQASNGTVFVFWSYKATASNHYQIYYRYLKASTWSAYTPLPLTAPTSLNDTQPSTALGKDGTLWLVWTRDNTTAAGSSPVMRQLWYKTLNSAAWSQEQSITSSSDVNWNFEPSVVVGKDGLVRIAYARGVQSPTNFQINYIYRAGSGWSVPNRIVTSNSTASDTNPSLIQDRNGTLRVFWTRDMTTNFVVRGQSSVDNGVHWIGETAITAACSGCADSEQPAAVQSSTDKNMWVFYSTNPTISTFSIWALETTSPIFPVHDVSLSTPVFSLSNSLQYAGGFPGPYGMSPIESIYINVQNAGDQPETVTLHLTVSNTTIYSFVQTIQVANGNTGNFAFNWNTTGVKPAWYRLLANATIPIETLGNRGDNAATISNAIHLYPLGDVNQDGSVTIVDISIADLGYGATPGNSRWNPWADITGGGIISIVDINYITYHYGIMT